MGSIKNTQMEEEDAYYASCNAVCVTCGDPYEWDVELEDGEDINGLLSENGLYEDGKCEYCSDRCNGNGIKS